jgi:uncharacterized coiled-coil protein SlyX
MLPEIQMKDDMEKRITTLEVRMDQTAVSIDRLDRSISDLRTDMENKFTHLEDKIDRRFLNFETKFDQKFVLLEASIASQRKDCDKKFNWIVGLQLTSLLAAMTWMSKFAQID